MDGFINLLKPPGMTSSDAVVFVRKRLPRGVRVGHGGTLDPDAAGVLPIMVGRAARLFDYIVDKRKTYIAELMLGQVTDTQDATGRLLSSHEVMANASDVKDVLPSFVGQIMQCPPAHSAIKRDGKRLYELAHKGELVQTEPRPVMVHDLIYLGENGLNRHLIQVDCGKGLYVRTLMHDIGQALGCGGHMSFLLRSSAGSFSIDQALTPDEIDGQDLEKLLMPMDMPIGHLPRVDVDSQHERAIRNGNPVRADWLDETPPEGALRVYCGGQFCGMGEAREDGSVRFKAMLLTSE